MWLGRRVAARGICLSFQIGQILRTFTISPTTNTTGRHLGFERDYNYHAAFRVCDVIVHKIYFFQLDGHLLVFHLHIKKLEPLYAA